MGLIMRGGSATSDCTPLTTVEEEAVEATVGAGLTKGLLSKAESTPPRPMLLKGCTGETRLGETCDCVGDGAFGVSGGGDGAFGGGG